MPKVEIHPKSKMSKAGLCLVFEGVLGTGLGKAALIPLLSKGSPGP